MATTWWYRFRSALTGRTISEEQAAAHPATSVRERVDRNAVIQFDDLPGLRILLPSGLEITITEAVNDPDAIVLYYRSQVRSH